MVIFAYLSVVVCLVGLLMFALSAKPKVTQVGWEMFRIGLFVFLFCTCSSHLQISTIR